MAKISKIQQTIDKLVGNSSMFLQVLDGDGCPRRIWIEIRGDLRHIPALKNNRHPKFPGVDPMVIAKMRALSLLFAREARRQGHSQKTLGFGKRKIFISMLTAATKSRSNEDNAFTTIKDWLEPRSKIVGSKNKKKRGWGIGIIADDIQARGMCLKCEDLSMIAPYTRIVIEPWDAVKESMEAFFSNNGNVL